MKHTVHPNSNHWRRVLWGVAGVFLAACLLMAQALAAAQGGGRASFSKPDLSQFPEISFYLSAFDAEGNFLAELRPQQVVITEDGQTVSAGSVTLTQPGLQLVFAFNNGPLMNNRAGGVSRYEALQAALLNWMQTQAGQPDELTLLSNSGLFLTRSTDPLEWGSALRDFAPDLANTRPGLGSLAQALDMGTDPLPDPNMKRVILYITLMPDANTTAALPNLAARARQQGTRVFVWLVSSSTAAQDAGYAALSDLALSTGGQIFLFDGQNTLPDPEAYFRPLRYLYRVSYLSALRQSGEFRVDVGIQQPELSLNAGSAQIALSLRPPNPIFLSPPSSVERTWTEVSRGDQPDLTPASLELSILVEFPDQKPRELAYTRLLVNGQVVDENTSPPFDRFTWDLSTQTDPAQAIIQVEAADVLGLSQKTIELPVNILVEDAPGFSLWRWISPQQLALYGGVGVMGVALVVALILTGRKVRRGSSRKLDTDPLTQRVPIQQERGLKKRTAQAAVERQTWLSRAAGSAPARLVRQPQADARPAQDAAGSPDLPLLHRETTFGSDPQLAMVLLNSPAVDGLHARILMSSDGKFSLADAGSVAGTWVNYAPVSQQGSPLQHGDLVHIGGLAYRFTLSSPPRARQPRSAAQDESL